MENFWEDDSVAEQGEDNFWEEDVVEEPETPQPATPLAQADTAPPELTSPRGLTPRKIDNLERAVEIASPGWLKIAAHYAPDYEGEGDDSLLSVMGDRLSQVPHDLKTSVGGLIQRTGEMRPAQEAYKAIGMATFMLNPAGAIRDKAETISRLIGYPLVTDNKLKSPVTKYLEDTPTTDELLGTDIAGTGEDIAREGIEASQKIHKDTKATPGTIKAYIGDVTHATGIMLPALLAGAVTRNPSVVMGVMWPQVFGQEYAVSRKEGLTEDEASLEAFILASSEILTEKIPLDFLFSPQGKSFLRQIVGMAGLEGLQESIQGGVEELIGTGFLRGDMTLGEALKVFTDIETWKRIGYQGLVGAGMGSVIGTPGAALEAVSGKDSPNGDQSVSEQGPNGAQQPVGAPNTPPPNDDPSTSNTGALKPEASEDIEATFDELVGQDPEEGQTGGPYNKYKEAPEVPLGGKSSGARQLPAKGLKPRQAKKAIDDAANEAATSPKNNLSEPTDSQKNAENYKIGVVPKELTHGIPITVENPKGSYRFKIDREALEKLADKHKGIAKALESLKNSKEIPQTFLRLRNLATHIPELKPILDKGWFNKMGSHYGRILKTEGADGDHVDVFLGSESHNPEMPVFIIDQVNPETGEFDEHKVMMGFTDGIAARAGYLANYDKGWNGLGAIKQLTLDEFKEWLDGDTTKPVVLDAQKDQKDQKDQKPPTTNSFEDSEVNEDALGTLQSTESTEKLEESHVDGDTQEAITDDVVEDAVEEGAENTDLDKKQIFNELLADVDEQIKKAPEIDLEDENRPEPDKIGHVTFDVPGDGKFKVLNTKENLKSFRRKLVKNKASFGVGKEKKQDSSESEVNKGTVLDSIKEYLYENDYESAYNLAKLIKKPFRYRYVEDKIPMPLVNTRVLTKKDSEDLGNVSFFIGKNVFSGNWEVVDTTTGQLVIRGEKSHKETIKELKEKMGRAGIDKVLKSIKDREKYSQEKLETEFTKVFEKKSEEETPPIQESKKSEKTAKKQQPTKKRTKKVEKNTVKEDIVEYEISQEGRRNQDSYRPRQAGERSLYTKSPVQSEFYVREDTDKEKAREKAQQIIRTNRVKEIQVGTFNIGLKKIDDAAQAAHVFAPLRKSNVEQFMVLVLDSQRRPISILRQGYGTIDGSSVYPRDLLGAIHMTPGAHSVWVAHNHPSGNPTPSTTDEKFIKRINKLLKQSGVKFQGSIVVAPSGKATAMYEDLSTETIKPSPATRKHTIPITEGRLRKIGRADVNEVNNPNDATRIFDKLGLGSGILFMNTRNIPLAFYEVTDKELEVLRTEKVGTGSSRLFQILRENNANAMIGHFPDANILSKGLKNLSSFADLADVRLLDIIDMHGSQRISGTLVSPELNYYSLKRNKKDVSKEKQPTGVSISKAQEIVDKITKKWKNAPKINVVQSIDGLPEVPRGKADKIVEGTFWDGQVWLIADNLQTENDVQRVLFHEALGHYGLRQLLGKDVEQVLSQIYMVYGSKGLKDTADLYGFDLNTKEGRQRAAEEKLAQIAESGEKPGLIKRVIAVIRQWLRDHGFTLRLNDSDIRQMVANMSRAVREGKPLEMEMGVSASRASKQAPIFYSQMIRVLTEKLPGSAPAGQMRATIQAMLRKGQFKKEEYEWSDVNEWLAEQKGKIKKDQVLDFLRANEVQVEEVVHGGKEIDNNIYSELEQLKTDLQGEVGTIDVGMDGDISGIQFYDDFGSEAMDGHISGIRLFNSSEDGVFAESNKTLIRKKYGDDVLVKLERINEIIEITGTDTESMDGTRYGKWTLPGGKNYRELLLMLPGSSPYTKYRDLLENKYKLKGRELEEKLSGDEYAKLTTLAREQTPVSPNYKSSHFSEPNILAHVRFNERTDADGKRVLFIEEIQDDWHQQGREKGYKYRNPTQSQAKAYFGITDENWAKMDDKERQSFVKEIREGGKNITGVPDAPLKTTWPLFAFKRMIRWAAENGYDRIAWTTGEQQADRYDLSKQVSRIDYFRINQTGIVKTIGLNGEVIFEKNIKEKELEKYIGKTLAKKIRNSKLRIQSYTGLDLKVGGEGMIAFYDQMLPSMINKYVKKWGAKVGKTSIPTMQEAAPENGFDEEDVLEDVQSIDVTPQMRDSAMKGQPLFSKKRQKDGETLDNTTKEVLEDVKEHTDTLLGRYRARADKVIDYIDERLHPLSGLQDRVEYMKKRYLTQGKISKAQELATQIYNIFKDVSKENSEALYEYLTDAEGTLKNINDEKLKLHAQRVKRLINRVGKILVENGVIPSESYLNYKGRYLPRLYLAYLLGDKAVSAIGTGKSVSSQGYAKERNEGLSKEFRDVILGEIKDPAFLASRAIGVPLRDVVLIGWFEQLSKNTNWVLPKQFIKWEIPGMEKSKRVTPFWLKSEASMLRQRAAHYTDPKARKKALEWARKMDEAADEKLADLEVSGDDVPEGFKRLPNTRRFGALRGMIVKSEIFEDLVGITKTISEDAGIAEKVLGYGGWGTKATQLWKWSKVAANPPAQIRNLVSNWILLHLSGVPMYKIPKLIARAAREIATNGKYFQIGKKYGITESTFAANELFRIEREVLDLHLRTKEGFGFIHLKNLAAKVVEWTGDRYQDAEMLGKLMKIIHEMEANGKDEATAALEAQETLFDYSLVGKNNRYLRNAPVGAPFITFYLKVLPRLMETALHRPWKFLPYYLILKGSVALIAHTMDVDDDDVEKLKKALPDWIQERGHAMILPIKDQHGRWQAVDIGYFMPWSMWTELASNMYGTAKGVATGKGFGEVGDLITMSGLLSGPIPDIMAAISTGKDSFTGREIVNESDPASVQLESMLTYMYTMAMPSFMVGIPPFHDESTFRGASGHLYEALTGHVDRYGNPKSTVGQALFRYVGVNTYPIEPVESRNRNLKNRERAIDKIGWEIKKINRDKNLSAAGKERLKLKYKKKKDMLINEKNEYAKASKVHRSLR